MGLVNDLILNHNQEILTYKVKEQRYEKQIENARKRLEKHWKTYPHWTQVVKTICDLICEKTGYHYKSEFNTYGMRAECPIFFKDYAGRTVGYITFTPSSNGIDYDTGKKLSGYERGSIGALNGMDNITAPLPDTIEEVIEKCILKDE